MSPRYQEGLKDAKFDKKELDFTDEMLEAVINDAYDEYDFEYANGYKRGSK